MIARLTGLYTCNYLIPQTAHVYEYYIQLTITGSSTVVCKQMAHKNEIRLIKMLIILVSITHHTGVQHFIFKF